MKILYTSDVHGAIEVYFGVFSIAKWAKPDIIVFGGDMLTGGSYDSDRGELAERQKKCFDLLLASFSMLKQDVIFILGNDDLRVNEGYMAEMVKNTKNIHYLNKNYFQKDDFVFIGYPFVNPSPFTDKDFEKLDFESLQIPQRELPLDDPKAYYSMERESGYIYNDLKELFEKAPKNTKRILIAHAPPYNTMLDIVFDRESKKVIHEGSVGVRKIIEEYKPYASLHGHLHESHYISHTYVDTIGSTVSFNPGWAAEWMVNVILLDTESKEYRYLGFVDERGGLHEKSNRGKIP